MFEHSPGGEERRVEKKFVDSQGSKEARLFFWGSLGGLI